MPTLKLPRMPRRDTLIAGACVIGVHLILIALLWAHVEILRTPVEPDLLVALEPIKPLADKPAGAKSDLPLRQPIPQPAPIVPLPAAPNAIDTLSDAQLAGATAAGEGGSGGSCDMARRIQDALRRDPLVQSAVEKAGRLGTTSLLWNGDWVQSGVEEGRGLSVLREAIMWEVGFAPDSCRSQPMHGLVLLSLSDKQTRFALGTDNWRWSDLLGLHGLSSP